MVDIALLVGKLLLLVFLYLFLFVAVKAGVGLVRGTRSATKGGLVVSVEQGPKELKGTKVPLAGPVVIGRSPGADIVIADDFVSGRHAKITPAGDGALLEDLGSTNGTIVNGAKVGAPVSLGAGSVIDIGTVRLKVVRS
ncbi:MAG: FHA domain-containing protein [Actinobacteria bacterium]|nr:MAG: FHA domain-containing protein [Actinomycetota bacterium]